MNPENLLIKREGESIVSSGKNPYLRTLQERFETGYINIDKYAGPTSHQVVDEVKQVLGIPKAGHSGTLDPQVTGVLLTGLGKTTRLMEYMLKSDKEYVCLMYLHHDVSDEKLGQALRKFTGLITQLPPLRSAVKREKRKRMIYSITFLEREGQDILFKVRCEKGTYIRTLCHDIGQYLGCGAQMKELRRTKAGPIDENHHIISVDTLRNLLELYNQETEPIQKDKYYQQLLTFVRPMEELLGDYKIIIIRDGAVTPISHGQPLAIPGVAKLSKGIVKDEEIAFFTLKNELIGMGKALMSTEEIMAAEKGTCAKLEKIFIDTQLYPKFEKKKV